MYNTVFDQEKTHLNGVLVKLGAAKKVLETSMRSIGVENLEKLKDMRTDKETNTHNLFSFIKIFFNTRLVRDFILSIMISVSSN